MTDAMKRFYTHYIGPQVENQPRDAGEELYFGLLDSDLCPHQKEALENVTAFYAAQGFRLGLKMGMALEEELRG